MSIANFITGIPAVIWSGVIASCLTLGGVLLSNRGNTNRLVLQLKHDAEEKAKQRKADMRKDVYLAVAEEHSKAHAYIATLPQLDLTKTNPSEGLYAFFAATARLQVVAETKTALLASDLASAYGALMVKLLVKLEPIQQCHTGINISDDLYKQSAAEVKRVLAKMHQFTESAQDDAAVFAALQSSFDFHQGQANKYAKECGEFASKKDFLHRAFIKEVFEELKPVADCSLPLIVEVRRELEVGGDLEEFKEHNGKLLERMNKQIDIALDSLFR